MLFWFIFFSYSILQLNPRFCKRFAQHIVLIDNFQKNPKISEYLGHYEIKGNTLIFYVEKLITKKETIELKEIQLLKFPITPVSEVTLMNGELTRKRIQIGSHEYFLFFGNPRK